MSPRFSIITPTRDRADGRLERCIRSVQAQTFRDYEHVIVDDGSKDDTVDVVGDFIEGEWDKQMAQNIRLLKIDKSVGRVMARNAGMEDATCSGFQVWLDSDDAMDPMYLATVDHFSREQPDVKLWVVGAVQHGVCKDKKGKHLVPAWTKLRHAWIPPIDNDGRHALHYSGKIGTGQFVYHRDLYKQIGPMPNWANHNMIASGIDEWLELPPGTTGYGIDNSKSPRGLVGDPNGEDHAYMARLCQIAIAHPINSCLYIHYKR